MEIGVSPGKYKTPISLFSFPYLFPFLLMSTRDNSIKVEAKFMDKNTNFNSPFYNNQAMFVSQVNMFN